MPQLRYRVNEAIRAPKVRLVGEGIQPGIYTQQEALRLAKNKELDLIQISDQGEVPVCKIMDFAKYCYERKKTQRLKDRAKKVTFKEVRIAPNIDDHDFAFKARHAVKFLTNGAVVRVYVFFKRKKDFYIYRNLAKERLNALIAILEEAGGKVKHEPKLLGRQIFTIIDPSKRAKKQ